MANTINLGRVKGSMWYTGTADSAAEIASAISGAGYTPVSMDLYLNVSRGNIYQYVPSSGVLTWALQGNIKGAKGDPFAVAKTYESVSAMNEGYASDGVKQGQFVIVETGDVNDEENARLYVKGAKVYEFITDLSGAQGIKGDKGEQGVKGETGARGERGEQGERGEKGDTGAPAGFGTPEASASLLAAGETPTVQVTASGDDSAKVFKFSFAIPKGDKGDRGPTGDKGADGKTPTLSINENGELIATFD